ncbi:Phosphate-selective porin O and P [Enhygromyxa salina]|uniref:Phosphate-selective porin O and P n=1 Tax=Enhygromyxa salina TaxID=215803 RepID=A0A2S9YL80_9BACT|nr:porin [Enhygromyxa salina]PRQ05871.1 Phosphate-selective porin O and P [Enhygromyxa salina]
MSLPILPLVSLLLVGPPSTQLGAEPGPSDANAPGQDAPSSEVAPADAPPAEAPPERDPQDDAAPDRETEQDAEVSPLVPRSQIEFLSGHPVDLERVQFRPGKGLTIASKSGKFSLTTGLRVQLLYTMANDHAADTEPPVSHSLQVRRARLVFAGHMFGEHNRFKAELSFSPKDTGLEDGAARYTILRDFYLEFDHLRDLTLRVGQYKLPYSQQRVISSGKLQLVDRSIVGSEFDFDRDIGLDLRSEDFLGLDRLRYYLGAYLGGGRDNFAAEPITRGGGLVYIARVEVMPFGSFKDYREGDFVRIKQPRLSLGAAYSFMDDAIFMRGTKGSVPTDGGTTNYHNATASMVLHIVGLSISSEFFWRRGVRRPGDAEIEDELGDLVPAPIEAPRDGLGWYVQSGFMIPHAPVELAARYSEVRAIGDDTQTSMSDRHALGGGPSWYIGGHAFKLQADYFRIWTDDIGQGIDQLRVQAQISF